MLVLAAGKAFSAEPAPWFYALPGLPASVHQFRSAEAGRDGWVLTASDGILVQGESWKLFPSVHGAEMAVGLPLKSGATIIAGYGFCATVSADGLETPLLTTGSFYSGATDGVLSLIVSPSAVYTVAENRVLAKKVLHTGSLVPRASLIDGTLVLFAPYDGVFEYTRGELRESSDFAFARGMELAPIFSGAEGDYVLTKQGFTRYAHGRAQAVLPELWEKLRTRAVIGGAQFGSQFIVASYYDGLSGYSAAGQLLWNIPTAALGGNLYFMRAVKGGFMLGSSGGVYVFPDPSSYQFSEIPKGDLHAVVPTSDGPLIAVLSSIVHPDGTPANFPSGILSVQPFGEGFVEAYVGYLKLPGGKAIPLPDRDVPQMAVSGDRLAVVHGQKLSLVFGGELHDVELNYAVNSVAVVDGAFMIGTNRGAVHLSREGVVLWSFGAGLTHVLPVAEDGAVVFDSSGTLYNPEGETLGKFPFSELVSAVNWRNSTVLLGRLPTGKPAFVRITHAGAQNLDLPLATAAALAVDHGRLSVIGSGLVLSVSEPEHLRFPREAVQVATLGGALRLRLAANEDTVVLRVPPARLGPWAVPSYQYQVRTGAETSARWEDLPPGAIKRVPRLAWGTSRILVRSSLGLETRTQEFVATRAYPFWATWPAGLGYLALAAAAMWGLIAARTRHLNRQARELQALVDSRTADLKRAQAAREEFFSTLSHEIRNPLNGVVGLCDILAEAPPGSVGPKEKRLVTTLKGCAAQLRSMLDDVLDFSRIDRGDIQLNEETFDLVSAIEGSVRSIDAALASSELVIPHDPIWVSGDCGKLRQIVTNLASNGLKYGEPSRIRVTLFTQVTREGALSAQIAVSNSGQTIPEAELTRIFEGFARGEDAIRRRIPGSGLGLAVSRRMAHAMGGSLRAQSHEGLTVFSLEVTLQISDAPVEVTLTQHKPKLSRALAIEDESYNRVVLGHILGQLGYSVDWAVDGSSAMERIKSEAYDLVLTDYLLPDINGSELARRILLEVSDPKPPVIAVTAYSTPEKIAELRGAGVSGIVAKPVSLEKLRTAIMALAVPTGRRSLDTARASVECDFRPILSVEGGLELLAKYAQELPEAWSSVIARLDDEPEEAAKEVHAFLSRILVVGAGEVGDQLGELENALRLANYPEVRRLADTLTPMVEDIATKAKLKSAYFRS